MTAYKRNASYIKFRLLTIAILAIVYSPVLLSCNSDKPNAASGEQLIFPKGELGPATNFTGKAYNFGLIPSDSTYNTLIGNVYFEVGARSNWHTIQEDRFLSLSMAKGIIRLKVNRGKP